MGLWNRILGREDDTRPDPEDPAVFEHADLVDSLQRNRSFPLQTLKGGGRPSDVELDKNWVDPPPAFSHWVDVYEGPLGIGYVVNYETLRGRVLFRKSINYGPERFRESDWTEVVEPPVVIDRLPR